MKTIKYLSPSGISTYTKDPDKFYMMYLSECTFVRDRQLKVMSIGSAFDAYAKSFLHEHLFGKGNDPKFAFEAIFEAQVDSQWRDWARMHGRYVFDKYRSSGALTDLMLDLEQAVNIPKFEIEIMGAINNQREPRSIALDGVILLGKPDVFYINKFGAHVILDWKVNGYLSKGAKSPSKGYVKLRSPAGYIEKEHKDCILKEHHGSFINSNITLDKVDSDWARQLSIYAWLCGCDIGEEFIAGIDQICCSNKDTPPEKIGEFLPDLKFAEHRCLIPASYQFDLFNQAADLWDLCHSDHFFRNLSKADSDARCKMLDDAIANKPPYEEDPLIRELTSNPFWRKT